MANNKTAAKDTQTAKDNTRTKKTKKKSSALVAASKGRSAVNSAMANSSMDVRGSNGLANTGPVTSYENED